MQFSKGALAEILNPRAEAADGGEQKRGTEPIAVDRCRLSPRAIGGKETVRLKQPVAGILSLSSVPDFPHFPRVPLHTGYPTDAVFTDSE